MEFPRGWRIEVKTDAEGRKEARYIPPHGPPLTSMRQLIARFPDTNFGTFNRHTGKFQKGHRNSAYKNRKKWLPQFLESNSGGRSEAQAKASKEQSVSKKVARKKLRRMSDKIKLNNQRFSSEPVYLNSILCDFFGFEFSEELFERNEEFLQRLCDLTPSSSEEWLWVWRKERNFSEEENWRRMSFFTGIWRDECFERHVGPLYAHEESEEDLMKEAEEMRKMAVGC